MDEERYKEEIKVEDKNIVTSHSPSLPHEPYTWLMIVNGVKNASEQHIFYSITEDRFYVRFIPDLQSKYVYCCYGGCLVLKGMYTGDYSILNILTMEKMQLPPLNICRPGNTHPINTNPLNTHPLNTSCAMSSPKMDRSCRIIFFERELRKIWSCHLGDSEFIERESTYRDKFITALINFKGNLYGLDCSDKSLIAFDFSDPNLHHEQVVSGDSLEDFIFSRPQLELYLVESGEDLLFIIMGKYDYEVSDFRIFKADFSTGQWVKLETLGDRAIFLGERDNSFSSPATMFGMKSNVVYWVRRTPTNKLRPDIYLYKYDIEDKSISMSLPFPALGTYSFFYWVSFPMTCNEDKKLEKTNTSSLFEAFSIETNFHVQRKKTAIESTELQIKQEKTKKREEREAIGSMIVGKKSSWANLPNDLLLEILPQLFAGDRAGFRSTCKSWYSVTPPCRTTHQFALPLKSGECSSPFLIFPENKVYHPILGKLNSSMNFLPDIQGANVRAARNEWLLMDYYQIELCFYNPFTRAFILVPECNVRSYYSVYFSAPPTSSDCLVVVAALRQCFTNAICFIKLGDDEGWTYREGLPESFLFSNNSVVYRGLFYFLGHDAKLLIFDPKNDKICVIEAPRFLSNLKARCAQKYMLESDDGKLIAVFVAMDGSLVYTCRWNVSTSTWEMLGSLGNTMLFVSRPLSSCTRATVSGTGNKIYFPRFVGDDCHIWFYSLATKRYHTFEMGTGCSNFFGSKFYPQCIGWFMPSLNMISECIS